ncbi:MAG: DNA glycosylase AlkZ-like family protein, partial [Thermomicrobiales bacterium]
WAGDWYVAAADLPLLDALAGGDTAWEPRTTLLSPFDNLICDRKRTALLFDFDYRIEIYTPKEKRRWGYYVLPILHGDRLIGRIDPTMNRARAILTINAVHAESGAPADRTTARAIARAITDLATFLGARDIAYAGPVPAAWRTALRA